MEPTINIRFLQDGDSPDVGAFVAGDERLVGYHHGRRFIECGVAVEVVNSGAAAPAEEDVENGGQ